MEHANLPLVVTIFVISLLILGHIARARRGKDIFVRRIPGLNEIEEAVGRAAEMGKPLLFHPGTGQVQEIGTLAALGVLGHVARQSARMGLQLIVTTFNPVMVPVVEGIVKQAYEDEGQGELYDPGNVRFLAASGDQLALATADLMRKEKTASHFFFGVYDYTSLLLAEPGNHTGAMQIAGTDQYFQIPFFIASCDYTVIGEELYAASAYLTRESTMLGSLIGQDYAKILLVALIVAGAVATTFQGVENVFSRLFGF
jgi:hypothetical protein